MTTENLAPDEVAAVQKCEGAYNKLRDELAKVIVGQNEEATPLLISVREARPDLWGTSYYLGKAQLALGNAAAALPLLRTAASRAPDEAPVQYQLARALQALGRKAEAKLAFARVSRLKSKANSESILMK